jgi:hypothetical protein
VVVDRRLNSASKFGIAAVSPYGDRAAFHYLATIGLAPTDTHHLAVVEEVIIDAKSFAKLSTTVDRRVDQYLVQRRASRTVPPGNTVLDEVACQQGKVANVEDHVGDWRRPHGDLIQYTPVPEPPRSMSVNKVTVRNVVRKRRAVH